jgi:hypothetical protein
MLLLTMETYIALVRSEWSLPAAETRSIKIIIIIVFNYLLSTAADTNGNSKRSLLIHLRLLLKHLLIAGP